jgi:hypothetical protein
MWSLRQAQDLETGLSGRGHWRRPWPRPVVVPRPTWKSSRSARVPALSARPEDHARLGCIEVRPVKERKRS